eukprot:TRINITY_DN21470_c2_g1_i1.p1 TRINITY_DN21470_c2_g1~~TRINITY_DN21470_c2_g1_i1.p1  ORF type:complete len:557 (+),score=110.71 TRINITY_DN21470_c2_g1_i1:93-1763(+)
MGCMQGKNCCAGDAASGLAKTFGAGSQRAEQRALLMEYCAGPAPIAADLDKIKEDERRQALLNDANEAAQALLQAAPAVPRGGKAKKAPAETVVAIDPNATGVTWEGWGVSLAWWANVFGADDTLARLAWSTCTVQLEGRKLPGLGLNIARYNLGACSTEVVDKKKMKVSPRCPAFREMEGFWLSWYSSDPSNKECWNWTRDSNQVQCLLKAKQLGVTHFELFSNSPMWWMCGNHNPCGANAGGNNLMENNFVPFARYLAITARYFKDNLGIKFTSVEPFNEPQSTWWTANGTQEGCHFDTKLQAWILGQLANELNAQGLFGSLPITASDENRYDQAVKAWKDFAKFPTSRGETAQQLVSKVNVHGYQYQGNREALRKAVGPEKTIWQSEFGENDGTGLWMASCLISDMKFLRNSGWCYWQLVDEVPGWGLIQGTTRAKNPTIVKVETKFLVLAHYSRHIRPGMTILDVCNPGTVAAYDAGRRRLVIVCVSWKKASKMRFDLSKFKSVGGPVTRWSTDPKGGDEYREYSDITVQDGMVSVEFKADSVNTLQIENVC